jgi:hypothetical protein
LLRGLRQAVLEERTEQYAKEFFHNYYRDEASGIPVWIRNAMKEAGVGL